ncbi:Ring finger protein [Mactra antiquata]
MQVSPTCPRCSAIFGVKDGRPRKKPLILNCGHTFCESCLHQLAKDQRMCIVCPVCKVKTDLVSGENSIKSLCPDRYIMGSVVYNQKTLLEHELGRLKEMTDKCGPGLTTTSTGDSDSSSSVSQLDPAKVCRECSKNKATMYCPKCDCNMCAMCCSRVHLLSRSLQLHVPVAISEEGDISVSQTCKLHENRTVEYYCDDDETVICSRCVIMGTHKGHNISSIEEKNRKIINEMEPKLQMANHVHRRLKKIDTELKSRLPDYKKELVPILDGMRVHFQQLHGLLQLREQEMEQVILQSVKKGVGPFETLRTDLQNEYVQLAKTIKAAERIMKNTDDVVVNAKDILDKLIHAKDIPCIIEEKPDGDSDVSLRFVDEPDLSDLIKDYGKIAGSIPQRFTMHTLREMPEKFSEDFEDDHRVESINGDETPRSITPLSMDSDMISVTSGATSQSEDVIIEEEQEIVLDGGTITSETRTKIVQHKDRKKKESLEKLPPKKRFKGQHETVVVTHIQSPCKFMVQLRSDSSKISVLSHSLSQYGSTASTKQHVVSTVKQDDLVIAQYSLDKKWYRGRVKNVIEPESGEFRDINVEVLYIDYGNTEVVNVQKLRKMREKFMKYPEFAFECSLCGLAPANKDGTWSIEAVNTFAKMVENQCMLLTVVREENYVLQVDLCKPGDDDIVDDSPMSVKNALVFMDLAKMESNYSLMEPYGAPAQKRNFLTPAPKEEGVQYCVKVIYAGTPDCFYVQELGEEISYLATMMAHIQDTYQKPRIKDSWHIISPQVGMICVSKFSGDGLWYRARIIELPGNRKITVQYVDYGNIETVDISKLRKIIDSFIILPSQALCCSLVDVSPLEPDNTWSRESLQHWSDMVTMQSYMMKVIHYDKHSISVVLRDPENIMDSINIQVVDKHIASTTGPWSRPQRMTELSSQMNEYTPRLSYQVGDGMFPEPCDAEHQPVYWKSRNTRPVRRYEETRLTPPSSPERSSQSSQKRDINTSGKRTTRKITGNVATQAVTQPDMNTDVTPSTSTTEVSRDLLPERHTDVEVVVSHLVSPSEFYLQKSSALEGENGLKWLMDDINNTYQHSEDVACSWTKGKYCIAYSTKRGQWYRAKIIKCFQKGLVEVFMLDYGFTEVITTSNLRQIVRQYRKQRCFAFLCKLADVTPAGGMKEWSKTACEYMQDQTTNRTLLLIKKGGVDDGKLPIDVVLVDYVEESALEPGRKTYTSLVDSIKERGLAIPVVKKHSSSPCKEKVYPVLYYKKAEAEVKSGDKVMPVYVDYDAVVHCYTMEGDDVFQSMCDLLHQKFKDSDPHGPEQTWVKGQACAAFYDKDGQWHRASIKEIEDSKLQVHFIDYGNNEWVGYDQVRADIAEFTDIPQQTFLCTLHDIHPPKEEDEKWDTSILELMHKELVNKYCYITIVEKFTYEDKPMCVNLELNGKDFGSYLVQHGLANRGQYITDEELQSTQIAHVLEKTNPFKQMKVPEIGDLLHVLVTHVELPNVVYVQPIRVNAPDNAVSVTRNKHLDQLEQLSAEINQTVHTLPVVPYPKPGVACIAQFSFDQCWYRAVIVCVYEETEQILVLFVDYGNSEITTINKLRAMTPRYQKLPCQSLRCKLSNIKPVNDVISWTNEALMKMTFAVTNKPLMAKFINNKLIKIELYEDNEDNGYVYQSVIDNGFVQLDLDGSEVRGETPTSNLPKIEYPTVTVTEVTEVNSTLVEEKEHKNDDERENGDGKEHRDDDDNSESTVEPLEPSDSRDSKSWALMAEEGSSVDLNDLPELDSDSEVDGSSKLENVDRETDDSADKHAESVGGEAGSASKEKSSPVKNVRSPSKGVKSPVKRSSKGTKNKLTPDERKRLRDSRKVVTEQHDNECFD